MAEALAARLIGVPATGELLRWTMAQKRSASSAETLQLAAPAVNPRVTDLQCLRELVFRPDGGFRPGTWNGSSHSSGGDRQDLLAGERGRLRRTASTTISVQSR